jgi:hypothetical protein
MARQKIPREEVRLFHRRDALDQEGREFERLVARVQCVVIGIEKINDIFPVDQYKPAFLFQQFRQFRVVGLDFLFKVRAHGVSSSKRSLSFARGLTGDDPVEVRTDAAPVIAHGFHHAPAIRILRRVKVKPREFPWAKKESGGRKTLEKGVDEGRARGGAFRFHAEII